MRHRHTPGGTVGSAQADPEVFDTAVANQERTNAEAGGVFKPGMNSPEGGKVFSQRRRRVQAGVADERSRGDDAGKKSPQKERKQKARRQK
ncbi:hypothetical protein NDU88_001439 [Pleurodeles waltl]|uniref:Uncharacterized protein n=1 Tax=Pleurodeles waltl TaxID=8319 RepID=A0AAV7VYZ2_PLEWA|nr:hypothetical protein NDU88_001439 [Pleurodeles waltl]